ncbi:MAG: hypothetical protein M5U01_03945 [Ardenticatenaceae bacterium]|nr:hypothetical protein [Ardenticatenaceae bacterium]
MDVAQRLVQHFEEDSPFVPSPPTTIAETGLTESFLTELVLKLLYVRGVLSGYEAARETGLPLSGIIEESLDGLRREHLIEVRGAGPGLSTSGYQYVISERGRQRAREVMAINGYVGVAPVPLPAYRSAVQRQSLAAGSVSERDVRQGLAHLVLREEVLRQLGPAVNSGRSIFLWGPTGNGKTAVAEAIGRILPGTIYIPLALFVGGAVIRLFDLHAHWPMESRSTPRSGALKIDGRWARIRRPLIVAGGELTMQSLDLVYDPTTRTHEAPFQLKANNGLFLIDDFGRQQVRPRDLLNRWILPLERRVDYLTLTTGKQIEVPFDPLILFSTNLDPDDLVDEAFLRRIRYKIYLPDPTFNEFREIFKRLCHARGIPYDDRALAYLVREYYLKPNRRIRACHARDVVDELVDIARFQLQRPLLTKELIDEACQSYFVRA